MATILKSRIVFTSVAAGATSTQAHGLNVDGVATIPDHVICSNQAFSVEATTDGTNVVVKNNGVVAANCTVLCEVWHTYERVFGSSNTTELTGRPFSVDYDYSIVGGGCSVVGYGADPTGATDSLAAIQLAVNSCPHVYIPPGTYLVTGTISVPSDTRVEGVGYDSNITSATNLPILQTINADLSKPSNITISGLRLNHTNTLGAPAAVQGNSQGIMLWGLNIEVSDVWFEECFDAVSFIDDESDISRNIRLIRLKATHSNPLANTSGFGLEVNTITGLWVEDCSWREAWLDGIKLRKLCTTVRIRDGESSDNGKAFGLGSSGDGIDCFAGGQDVVIKGTVFEDNGGNGIVIKTVGDSAALGFDFNPDWGWMRDYVLEGVACRRNKGVGIAIEGVYNSTSTHTPKLADANEDNRPRASNIKIVDPMLENNELNGALLNGFNVSLRGGVIRANYREGIIVAENARDTKIVETTLLGNSVAAAGTYPAVTVQAASSGTRFTRCTMNGKDHRDNVEIVNDASYAALTTFHRNGIEVENGGEEVWVKDCDNQYVTSDPNASPVVCFGDNVVILDHIGTAEVPNNRFFGGPGSTYRTKALIGGADGKTLFTKESVSSSKDGWVGQWGRKHFAQISADGVNSNLTCTLADTYYRCRAFDTDDDEYGADAQANNDRIVLASGAGAVYKIRVYVSWKSDVTETWKFAVHRDLVAIAEAIAYGIARDADYNELYYEANATLQSSDIIELYVKNLLNAGEVINFRAARLSVEMLDRGY